jgi:hypothetical protein
MSYNASTAGNLDYRIYFEGDTGDSTLKVYEYGYEGTVMVATESPNANRIVEQGGLTFGDAIPDEPGEFGYDAATNPGAFGFYGENNADWLIQVGSAVNVVTMKSTTGATLEITPATKVTGVLTTGSTIELGNAADTTLSRAAAGLLAVEGNTIPEVNHATGGIIFTGPTQVRSIAIPNANTTLLSTNAAVTVPQGGTGRATGTTAYALVATGTTATGVQQTLSQGAVGEILTGAGAALPVWTSTPDLGTPSAVVLTNATGLPSSGITTIVDSIVWNASGMSADGTQCADPAQAVINSGPEIYTIICADNDASQIEGQVLMPDSWDGGTVTFTLEYVQTAADTGSMLSDVYAMCRGTGETINNTWSGLIPIDDAAVTGSNATDVATSAAVTPNGTCAGGDSLFWRWEFDAASTTASATLHILGMKMEYTSNVGD